MADPNGMLRDGLAALDAGQPDRAARFGRALLLGYPGAPDSSHLLALALIETNEPMSAATWIGRAIAGAGDLAPLWSNLGLALLRSGAFDRAAMAYGRASRMDPGMLAPHVGMARSLLRRHPAQAAASARRALAIAPGDASAAEALASALYAGLEFRRCSVWADRVLAAAGGRPDVLLLAAVSSQASYRLAPSKRYARRAAATVPAAATIWSTMGDACLMAGDAEKAVDFYRRAEIIEPANPEWGRKKIFAVQYLPDLSSESIFAIVSTWAAHHRLGLPGAPRRPASVRTDARLRIGYLSADLVDHPISDNLRGLLSHHDKTKVAAFVYSLSERADRMTQVLQAAADRWIDVAGLSDAAIADRIRDDDVDIVVYVAGQTAGNRLLPASLRPAPTQVSLHDLTSSGLAEMDARFTDATLAGDGCDERFTEAPLLLPCFYLYDRPRDVTPAPGSMRSEGVSFGSFNNPAKLNREVVRAWVAILNRVPGSRLVLGYREAFGDPDVAGRVLSLVGDAGGDESRIDLLGAASSYADHLARIGRIDIALDPFPFNGATTTFEALSAGVPVISLRGSRFLGRVGASQLETVGLGDLVGDTIDDYVAKAAALASDRQRLNYLRRGLRAVVAESLLCDAETYTRSFEAALIELHHRKAGVLVDQGAHRG